MDTPILLFKIPKQKAIDSLQPYGEFLSYSWSPDGYKIAFCATGVDNRYDIFVSDWDGKNLKNITRSSSNECFPSWSIDNELTYTVCSEGRCRAVISDEKGLRVVQLPVVSTINVSTWTPDGKNILFVGEDNKAVYQIFITNPSGTDTRQITHTIENNIVPVLSSNGRNIFYQRMQIYETGNFNYNIFSIAIDGAIENPVTTGEELTSAMPSVAPFGNWIAFTKGQDSVYNIYVIDFDGKEQIQVTTGEDDKRVPGWRNIANP
jgi:Tol biopolymer transport system component